MEFWTGTALAVCLWGAARLVRRALRRPAPVYPHLAVARVRGLRGRAGLVERALYRPGERVAVADAWTGVVRVYCVCRPDGEHLRRIFRGLGCPVQSLTGV